VGDLCRATEIQKLNDFLNSSRAEFLAIYGRRRVGKTFLIKNHFKNKKCLFFSATGIEGGKFLLQRTEFCKQISNTFYNGIGLAVPKSWFDIFELLTKAIDDTPKNKKIVLFFDEFPWLVTPRANLLQALEYYWNQYWSNNSKIKLIICGSLASWIIKNIINNTGGLYKRVTFRIKLEPFSLNETTTFLKAKKVHLNNQQILALYMVTGGVPFYLDQSKKGLSSSQIIDQLCFNKNGILVDEIKGLFKSLFSESELYIKIAREIAKHRYGMSKSDLAKALGLPQSGRLVERLNELEDAGFIIAFLPYQHREKGTYYRVIDEYTMFYFKWIEPNLHSISRFAKADGFWLEQAQASAYKSWCGYAFESVCYKHLTQIMKALNLKNSALPYAWKTTSAKNQNETGAQIDLLFDRNDNAITVCEIKNTESPFIIDKEYAGKLKRKVEVFVEKTKTKKQVFLAMISVNGLKNTIYAEDMIAATVTLNDLFC
jgi:uncharacterized protein